MNYKKIFSPTGILVNLNKFNDATCANIVITSLNNDIVYRNTSNSDSLSEVFKIYHNGEAIFKILYEQGRQKIAEFINIMIQEYIEKKEILTETLDKYREINLLYNFGEKMSYFADIQTTADGILNKAVKMLKFDFAVITQKTSDIRDGVINNTDFFPNTPALIIQMMKIEKLIYKDKKADIISNIENDSILNSGPGGLLKSVIFAPLKVKNNIIGAIILGTCYDYKYKAQDLKLLTTIAAASAITIENVKLYEEQRDAFSRVVHSLIETVEQLDKHSKGHSSRVAKLSFGIGKFLKLNASQLIILKLASLLHDIGKIGIKDNDDYKKHPQNGYEITRHIKKLKEISTVILHHHENFDGTGFPSNLSGEEIPLLSRIISVSDYMDSLTTKLHYTLYMALEKIELLSGTKFDPVVIKALIEYHDNLEK